VRLPNLSAKLLWSLIGLLLACPDARAGTEEKPAAPDFRLGFIKSLFREMAEAQMKSLFAPFCLLVESHTGQKCRLQVARDPCQLGQWLENGEVEVGVYQGIEFAWICKEYANLRPLVLAINQDSQLQSQLVIRSDSQIKGFRDLKGKALAVPLFSHEHCYLFLQGKCGENGHLDMEKFFSRVTAPPNAEEALDDVVDGSLDGAVVDRVCLAGYQRRKPGRCARLKIIANSPLFPPMTVVYRAGRIEEAAVKVFRDKLLKTKENPITRTFLSLGKLTAFEAIPAEFAATLDAITRIYPRPKILASK
jgi:ABC-type phosphate/phosphonate transport system substrate-binding protein